MGNNMKSYKEVIAKIKSKGYWYFNFFPANPVKDRIPDRKLCENIVREASVHLRGWDYPYVPKQQTDRARLYFGEDYVDAYVDVEGHKETWRYYQSAQFFHHLCLSEDWFNEDPWVGEHYKDIESGSVFSVISAIYTLTEFFEFIRRLAKRELYSDGLNISITLEGIEDRRLKIFDPERVPLGDSYVAHIPNLRWSQEDISEEDLIMKSDEIAHEVICYIFETFGWRNLPREIIRKDQLRFLQKG